MHELIGRHGEAARHAPRQIGTRFITPPGELVLGMRQPERAREGCNDHFGPVLTRSGPCGLE